VLCWDCFTEFAEEELCLILRGHDATFTEENIQKHFEFSGGYHSQCMHAQWLREVVVEMSVDEQAEFLQFVTGWRQFPVGGLERLEPKFAVTCSWDPATTEADPDVEPLPNVEPLPTASTCTNHLKLPKYPTKEKMKEKLWRAIELGNHHFAVS
jgi:hypothetical protein